MKLSLSGKAAVVTGRARGIGASISVALAKSGVKVVINHLPTDRDADGFRTVEQEISGFGGECISNPGDVTDTGYCKKLCEAAVGQYGKLDIMVNSAGFANPKTSAETADEPWRNGIEVNLSAAFYLRAPLRNSFRKLTKKFFVDTRRQKLRA